MRAADVLLLALIAGAGGVIGALVRGYAAAGRVDASSTECAERPPGTQYATGGIVRSPGVPFGEDGCTFHEWVGPPPVRYMTYVGGPNRRGPGRPPPPYQERARIDDPPGHPFIDPPQARHPDWTIGPNPGGGFLIRRPGDQP